MGGRGVIGCSVLLCPLVKNRAHLGSWTSLECGNLKAGTGDPAQMVAMLLSMLLFHVTNCPMVLGQEPRQGRGPNPLCPLRDQLAPGLPMQNTREKDKDTASRSQLPR